MQILFPAKSTRPAAHLDRENTDRPQEEWRNVTAYDGYYEVSSDGRVRSLARLDRRGRRVRARIMAQECSRGPLVYLSEDRAVKTYSVMSLVADAFLPAKPAHHCWYHKTEQVLDNRVSNIASGTPSTKVQRYYALGLLRALRPDGSTIGDYSRGVKRKHDALFGRFDGEQLVARVCVACLVEKPLNLFMQGRSLLRTCRECVLTHSGTQQVGQRKRGEELALAGLRRCGKCAEVKRLDQDFYASTRSYLGRANECMVCKRKQNSERAEYRKAWLLRREEQARAAAAGP